MPEHRGKTYKKTLRFDEKIKFMVTRCSRFKHVPRYLSEKWIIGREAKLWGHCLSQGRYQPTDQQARRVLINFRTLPLLVVKQVESKFCRLFCTFGAEFQISFLVSLLLDSTKRVLFLPCKVIKMKKWNSWHNFFRWLCFFPMEIIGGQMQT